MPFRGGQRSDRTQATSCVLGELTRGHGRAGHHQNGLGSPEQEGIQGRTAEGKASPPVLCWMSPLASQMRSPHSPPAVLHDASMGPQASSFQSALGRWEGRRDGGAALLPCCLLPRDHWPLAAPSRPLALLAASHAMTSQFSKAKSRI